jgi:hypothetical protein
MKNVISTLIATILISGCAATGTTVTGFTDPVLAAAGLDRTAVYVNTSNIADREEMEHAFSQHGTLHGVVIVPSNEIVSLSRPIGDAKTFAKTLRQNDFDALLVVNLSDSSTDSHFDAALVTTDGLQPVWSSSANAYAGSYGSWSESMDDYSKQTVENLIENDVLRLHQ